MSHLFKAKDELFQGDALRIVDMPALTETFDLPRNLLLLHIDGAPSLTGLSLRSPWSKKFILRGVRDLQYFAAGGVELDVKSFDELLACKNLKHLVLAYTKLPSVELRKIANLHELQSLTLSGSDVDDQLVSDLTQLDKLKSLRIDDTEVTDAVMESVAKFSQLEQLSLHKTQVSGIGLRHLSSLKNFKQLHFGNNPIGTQEMQAIVDCKALKVLDLSGSQLSAESLAVLVNDPPPSLERLGLNGAIVEGRGLTTLVRKLPDLRIAVDHAEIEPQLLEILLASRNAISESIDEFTDLIPPYESLSWQAGEFNLSSSGEVDPRDFAPQSKDRLR